MKTIIALFTALTFTFVCTAQQYDLKLNLLQGQRYKLSVTLNTVANQSIGGQEMNLSIKIQYEFAQTVKSINPNGDFEMECEYTRIILDENAMGQKIAYDSDTKDTGNNEIQKEGTNTFSKIVGKKFTVVLSSKGKILDIKGLKKMFESIEENTKAPNTKKQTKVKFSDNSIRSTFESVYCILPENPVGIGDSWSRKNDLEVFLLPDKSNTTYTLHEVNNGIAKISMKGSIEMKKDSSQEEGLTMTKVTTGSYDGSYELNVNSGISSQAEITIPMKETVEMMGIAMQTTRTNSIIITNTLQN